MSPYIFVAALSLATVQTQASAQTQTISPGLWEMQHNISSKSQSAEMAAIIKEMEKAPPQIRKMMEENFGIRADSGKSGGMQLKTQTCLAPEDIPKEDFIQEGKTDGECTFTKVVRKGNIWEGTITCQGKGDEGVRGVGDFVATLHSPTHYSIESALRNPKGEDFQMHTESRRVAESCTK